jgi:hypothetical protein
MNSGPFFEFARERHAIYLRRASGAPRPWTNNFILQACRFTNVYRELDKTTVWFREHVREPMRGLPEVLLATVLFRWFNRISTGEALFLQRDMLTHETAFEEYIRTQDINLMRQRILQFCGEGPYVTGAFIINTPTGMSKLDGVLWAFNEFAKGPWKYVAQELLDQNNPLGFGLARLCHEGYPVVDGWGMEHLHVWLKQFPRLGDFMAYEIVCDLRYTDLLMDAPDKLTWANPGPGAKRGLSYLLGGSRKVVPPDVRSRVQQIDLMRQLLAQSLSEGFDGSVEGFPRFEMREIEHTLCEYAKYEMVKRKEGKTKGMFK